MKDLMYHYLVGNDVPPWGVALARSLLGAAVVGGLAFFNAWEHTNDIPSLIRATAVPVLAWIAFRAGIEGMLDTWKNGR